MNSIDDTCAGVVHRRGEGLRVPGLGVFAIARVAPRPVEALQTLRGNALLQQITQLRWTKAEAQLANERASVAMHGLIRGCEDRQVRRVLIEARRRIYNDRLLAERHTRILAQARNVEVQAALKDLGRARESVREWVAAMESTYAAIRAEERTLLRKLTYDEALSNGVVLSSPSLHQAISEERERGVATFDARAAQTERGLLRYLTRMVMKATPFGTFCHVLPVRIVRTDGDERATVSGEAKHGRTALRLNKRLYGTAWVALRKRPAVRAVLHVRAAPTLALVGDVYVALAALNRRETFQQVHTTPLLTAAVKILHERGTVVFGELVDLIVAQERFAATREEIAAYVGKLVDVGLLQVCAVVPEHEADWDVPLRKLLEPIEDATCQQVASSLGRLRNILDSYTAATAAQRAELLGAMREELRSVLRNLDIEDYGSEGALFEDSTAAAECILPIGPRLDAVFDTVWTLGQLLARVAPARIELATMRRFWEERYPTRERVQLLEFYQDYYRFSKRERLAAETDAKGLETAIDPYHLEFTKQLRAATANLRELVVNAWRADPSAEEVEVDLAAIEASLANVAARHGGAPSFAGFAQVAWRSQSPRLVMRRWMINTGYGKYFSRFLHVLPQSVLDEVRRRNATNSRAQHSEILGDFFFNGNLHPAMFQSSIAYPTSDAFAPDGAIDAHCLDVLPDEYDRNALCLRDRQTGERVVPIDLGFLGYNFRPPLYQTLVAFGNAPDMRFELPDRLPEATSSDVLVDEGGRAVRGAPLTAMSPTIAYRPRIVLAGSLVIGRRRWRVPAACIPRRLHGEQDAAFFIRLNEWRMCAGMPTEGYAAVRSPKAVVSAEKGHEGDSVNPRSVEQLRSRATTTGVDEREGKTTNGEGRSQTVAPPNEMPIPKRRPPVITRDAAKPQYIHFGSTVLVALFERLGGGLTDFIIDFEERYPADDDLLAGRDGRHSYELCIQFDSAMDEPLSRESAVFLAGAQR